jgi:hypothetical protein
MQAFPRDWTIQEGGVSVLRNLVWLHGLRATNDMVTVVLGAMALFKDCPRIHRSGASFCHRFALNAQQARKSRVADNVLSVLEGVTTHSQWNRPRVLLDVLCVFRIHCTWLESRHLHQPVAPTSRISRCVRALVKATDFVMSVHTHSLRLQRHGLKVLMTAAGAFAKHRGNALESKVGMVLEVMQRYTFNADVQMDGLWYIMIMAAEDRMHPSVLSVMTHMWHVQAATLPVRIRILEVCLAMSRFPGNKCAIGSFAAMCVVPALRSLRLAFDDDGGCALLKLGAELLCSCASALDNLGTLTPGLDLVREILTPSWLSANFGKYSSEYRELCTSLLAFTRTMSNRATTHDLIATFVPAMCGLADVFSEDESIHEHVLGVLRNMALFSCVTTSQRPFPPVVVECIPMVARLVHHHLDRDVPGGDAVAEVGIALMCTVVTCEFLVPFLLSVGALQACKKVTDDPSSPPLLVSSPETDGLRLKSPTLVQLAQHLHARLLGKHRWHGRRQSQWNC